MLHERRRGYYRLVAEYKLEAIRVRERGMRRFKSFEQAQRFLRAHAAASNIFNLGRHLVPANHYRDLSVSAFTEWGGGCLRIEFRL